MRSHRSLASGEVVAGADHAFPPKRLHATHELAHLRTAGVDDRPTGLPSHNLTYRGAQPEALHKGEIMLTIWGGKQRFCDGISRRNFLKIGAFGAGLSLAELLRLKASAAASAPSSTKAAIMIYLPGGPSHIDMYDLKPDAPVEYRGEFK